MNVQVTIIFFLLCCSKYTWKHGIEKWKGKVGCGQCIEKFNNAFIRGSNIILQITVITVGGISCPCYFSAFLGMAILKHGLPVNYILQFLNSGWWFITLDGKSIGKTYCPTCCSEILNVRGVCSCPKWSCPELRIVARSSYLKSLNGWVAIRWQSHGTVWRRIHFIDMAAVLQSQWPLWPVVRLVVKLVSLLHDTDNDFNKCI